MSFLIRNICLQWLFAMASISSAFCLKILVLNIMFKTNPNFQLAQASTKFILGRKTSLLCEEMCLITICLDLGIFEATFQVSLEKRCASEVMSSSEEIHTS